MAPNIATITILLATQTLNTLSKAEPNHLEIARELMRKFSSQETCLADLKQTALNIATAQDGVCPFKSYDASTKPHWNAAGRQALVGPDYSATLGKDVLTELDGSPALLPLRRSIAEKASNPAGDAPQARDARSTQVCILLRVDRVSVAARQLVQVQLYRR